MSELKTKEVKLKNIEIKNLFDFLNKVASERGVSKEVTKCVLANLTGLEQIYVEEGEGCLSVNRPVEGIVPRYARVTMEAYDMEGRKIHVRGREELAICFQHEFDHLNGILFIDHIDSKNPFKNKDQMRGI